MSNDLKGRVALVTSAAGAGIGQACVRALSNAGAAIAVTDLHEGRAKELADEIAKSASVATIGLRMDVSDESEVTKAIELAQEALGPVDILVNNSGFNLPNKIWDVSTSDWDRILRVSLTGQFLPMRTVLPGMIERNRGAIVNISSVAAWTTADEGIGPYSAAKAGVLALTRNAAIEAAPYGVRVNSVAPGATPNPYLNKVADSSYFEDFAARTPLGLSTPESIADAVLFLASDSSRHVTGECINVSGGYHLRP